MSIGVKTGRFKFQRGTKKEREESNLILLDGELAIEADTRKIKIGDGKSEYSELPYISIGQIDATSLDEDVLKLISGPKGKDGKDLTFDDLTADQKEELRGEKGEKGQDGTVEFDELTDEQKESLKGDRGEKGNPGKNADPLVIEKSSYDEEENTVIQFSDGNIIKVKKGNKGDPGKDGTVSFDELTEEQRKSLKGEQGNPGKDGEAGADGKSAYVHIAWGNSPAGYKDFSTTDSTDKLYMGVYTDSNEEGSSDAKDYKWSKIKGEAGASGKDGEPGKDGTSVTIKSTNKVYDTTTVTFSDGKSIEIKDGAKGEPGEPGKDGAKGDPGKDGKPGKDGQDGKVLMKVVNQKPTDIYSDPPDTLYVVI